MSCVATIRPFPHMGLFLLLAGVLCCAPQRLATPTKNNDYVVVTDHCHTNEKMCPDGGCCPEDDACGGTPGCPPNACCYTGHYWWDNLPPLMLHEGDRNR
jgi:hypothetical protein